MGISKENLQLSQHINTPNKLVLGDPAKCIDDTYCQMYFIKGIMLGQEIIIDACVWTIMINQLMGQSLW